MSNHAVGEPFSFLPRKSSNAWARGKMLTSSKLRWNNIGSRKHGGPADGRYTPGFSARIPWATLMNFAIILRLAMASYVPRG